MKIKVYLTTSESPVLIDEVGTYQTERGELWVLKSDDEPTAVFAAGQWQYAVETSE